MPPKKAKKTKKQIEEEKSISPFLKFSFLTLLTEKLEEEKRILDELERKKMEDDERKRAVEDEKKRIEEEKRRQEEEKRLNEEKVFILVI